MDTVQNLDSTEPVKVNECRNWLNRQRSWKQKGKLSAWREVELIKHFGDDILLHRNEILEKEWNDNFQKCYAFFITHGRVVAKNEKQSVDFSVEWFWSQKSLHHTGKMPADHSNKMTQSFGEVFSVKAEEIWDKLWHEKFDRTREWVETHGALPTKGQDYKLSSWFTKQKKAMSDGELSIEKTALIKEHFSEYLESRESLLQQEWEQRLIEAQNFVASHGRMPLSTRTMPLEERSISAWLRNQISRHLEGKLPLEMSEKMIAHFGKEIFKTDEDVWDENFGKLQEFYKLYKRFPNKNDTDKALRVWFCNMRYLLTDNSILILNEKEQSRRDKYIKYFGGLLKSKEKQLDEHFSETLSEYTAFFNTNKRHPLDGATNTDEKRLAGWRAKQKADFKKGKMSQERLLMITENVGETLLESAEFQQEKKANEFIEFCLKNKRLPSGNKSASEYEQKIKRWWNSLTERSKNSQKNEDLKNKIILTIMENGGLNETIK